MASTSNGRLIKPVYEIEDRPPLSNSLPLALQHILAMFAGNITAPILVTGMLGLNMADRTFLIQAALLAAAIATLIQVNRFWKIGSRLPIVMGTSNAFIPTVMGIASRYGIGAVLGAGFIGGLFEFGLGSILSRIRKIFTNLVTGIVVLTIGLTLIPVGIRQAAGGAVNFGSAQNLLVSALVLVSIIVLNQFGKGYIRASSILLGMGLGYIVAIGLGMVDFSAVREAAWFAVPTPFRYQWSFPPSAVIAMLMMYVVTAVETVGDASAITMGGAGREASEAETTGAVLADGLASSLASVFNAFPNTSYSQNVGVVTLTGVMSRHVVKVGAFILLAMSLFPKLAAVISVMPTAVLGGAAIIMFSMVASSGFVILQRVTLNRRNQLIIAVSLGLGVGLNLMPSALGILPDGLKLIFAETGVATATLSALLLDQVLPHEET